MPHPDTHNCGEAFWPFWDTLTPFAAIANSCDSILTGLAAKTSQGFSNVRTHVWSFPGTLTPLKGFCQGVPCHLYLYLFWLVCRFYHWATHLHNTK